MFYQKFDRELSEWVAILKLTSTCFGESENLSVSLLVVVNNKTFNGFREVMSIILPEQ